MFCDHIRRLADISAKTRLKIHFLVARHSIFFAQNNFERVWNPLPIDISAIRVTMRVN
jgi:hypothetical protein